MLVLGLLTLIVNLLVLAHIATTFVTCCGRYLHKIRATAAATTPSCKHVQITVFISLILLLHLMLHLLVLIQLERRWLGHAVFTRRPHHLMLKMATCDDYATLTGMLMITCCCSYSSCC